MKLATGLSLSKLQQFFFNFMQVVTEWNYLIYFILSIVLYFILL